MESGKSGYTSRDVANAFDRICFSTGYGYPSVVYSDNESVFGADFRIYLSKIGTIGRTVSPYSPFSTFWERLQSEVGKQVKCIANSIPNTGRAFQEILNKVSFIINRRQVFGQFTAVEVFMLKYRGRNHKDIDVMKTISLNPPRSN